MRPFRMKMAALKKIRFTFIRIQPYPYCSEIAERTWNSCSNNNLSKQSEILWCHFESIVKHTFMISCDWFSDSVSRKLMHDNVLESCVKYFHRKLETSFSSGFATCSTCRSSGVWLKPTDCHNQQLTVNCGSLLSIHLAYSMPKTHSNKQLHLSSWQSGLLETINGKSNFP